MELEESLAAFSAEMAADLGRLLMAASAAVNARVLADLDPMGESGVRQAHAPLIAALDADGTRMVDLAARMGVTRQAVAALAHDLVEAGIVTISQDPADARAVRVNLTEAGSALCKAAAEYMVEREKMWREQYGSDSIDQLRELLAGLANS